MFNDLSEFHDWFAARARANRYEITVVPLERMAGWRVDRDSGDVVHESGKFFSVRGLVVETDHRVVGSWSQPIIVQPEIGILGIVVRVIGDVVHCLMQVKMEPGNINLLQLSPTVQATRSNYTRVHGGSRVPYLEHFVAPRRGRATFDALQSEQGSWFLNKRNRNMIVEVTEEVPPHDDFCWLSVGQIAELMKVPNLVNMDARTVLSGIPLIPGAGVTGDPWPVADHQAGAVPLYSVAEILSWFTEVKAHHYLHRRLVPLREVPHWVQESGRITHQAGRHFEVLGVQVYASNREVSRWAQPMLAPRARGVIAFVGRYIRDTFHVLVHARTEAGTHDVVEMAPTVSCIPDNYAGIPTAEHPRFLDVVTQVPLARTLVDVLHSEEGGRFYHAENRYLVVDAGTDFPLEVPDDYCWMTIPQLSEFVRYGNHVNVAARCLVSCLVGHATPLAGARS